MIIKSVRGLLWHSRLLLNVGGMEKCVRTFVCDSNGRWLKDLHLLCCIYILLASVEGRLVGHWRSKSAALKC
jgi:hypothetical protein